MRHLLVLVLAATLFAGCDAFVSHEPTVMCDVGARLASAYAITASAAGKDELGDANGARRLAQDARTKAENAKALLQTIESDKVRAGEAWQALLVAYLHVGQGANALLPGFENTHGMTRDELVRAADALATAAAALPRGCFAVPD